MARVKDNYRNLTGADKAAIFMLSLEAEHSAVLLENMEDDEIKELWNGEQGKYPDQDDVDKMFADFVPMLLAC